MGFQRQVLIGGGLKIDVVKKDRWWIGPSGGLLKRFFLDLFLPLKKLLEMIPKLTLSLFCFKWVG